MESKHPPLRSRVPLSLTIAVDRAIQPLPSGFCTLGKILLFLAKDCMFYQK